MMEQDLLSDFYIKRTSKSILEPKGTFKNNPYCEAIMRGLTEDLEGAWRVPVGSSETVFKNPELKEDFLNVLTLFFNKKWRETPEVTGIAELSQTDFSLTTSELAIEVKGKVPMQRTIWISSDTVYPFQFLLNAEDVILDTDLEDFKLKDFLWFIYRPGGFLLSLDIEQLGVLIAFLGDIVKRQPQNSFEENVKISFRPKFQEGMFTAFASFYKYLKESGSLASTVYNI